MRINTLRMKILASLVVVGALVTVLGIIQVTGLEASDEVPGAPEVLRVQASDAGVVLTWDAPAGDVTGYQILRRKPQECQRVLLVYVEDTGSDATTFTDTEVHNGLRYTYRVKAINVNGVGKRSNFATLTYGSANRADRGAPHYPRNLDGIMTRGGIRLTWDAPADGPAVTGYQILRRLPQECNKRLRIYVADTGNTDTVFYDDDFVLNKKYVYRVKAINANGVGKWSNYTSLTASEVQIVMMVGRGYTTIAPGRASDMKISITHLEEDSDALTVDYILRGDATRTINGETANMDACEGSNLGTDISIKVVDELEEQFDATFGGSGCTEPGEYTVTFALSDGSGTFLTDIDVEYEVKEVETIQGN